MDLKIRRANEGDLPDLQRLEHEHFPARPGYVHHGFLFDNARAMGIVTKPDDRDRWFTIVAEDAGAIVGFAIAIPSTRPGDAAEERYVILLQNMAVEESHRLQGVGQALVQEIERLARGAGQVLIQAHASIDSAPFYKRIGWDLADASSGIGWLIPNEVLGADFGHVDDGFPIMAVRVLEQDAILGTFHFRRRTRAPLADAGAELRRLVAGGTFSRRDLHPWTIQILDFAESRAKNTGAFGQKP
jgi:predicted N-acetyltransferase YhbS